MMSDSNQAEARPAREARVEQLLQFILDDSEGGKSAKEKKDNQIVPVELGLSPDVIERLPKNVKEWKPIDAEMWLQDIFDGSSLLPQYIESFQRIGVRGIDLLAAKENEITEFGITMAVHVARIKACIDDLIRYQRYFEAEKATDNNMRKVDQGYYDLDKAYREKCVNGTIYVPTKKMERWTDVDVFAFLSNPQHNNQLNAFIKPIANKKLNGKELLEAVSFIPETDVSAAKVIEKMDMPIVADARDFSRFRSIVLGEKSKLDVFHRRLKSENVEAMRRLIPKLDSSKLDPQIRNGRKPFDAQGSFGEVYFGKYEKRTVAIKQLKSRDSEVQSETPTTTKDGKIVPMEKDDIQSKLANHNLGGMVIPNDVNRAAGAPATKSTDYKMSELLFEAYMLAQCSGAGVIQLLGFDDATSPNRLVTEFMASLSICDEMSKADANDERSIFHPNHERNRLEMANGIMNPVLYQIVRIGKDISSALARIHGLGIVHLDIAARNILLNARKQPKIADFGLAVFEKDMKVQFEHYRDRTKHIHASSVQDQERRLLIDIAMTEDLDEIAVRNYKMQNEKRPVAWSPSWVLQENPLLDSHADIYAFGCFLYEMLTHRPPHADLPTQEIIAKKARGDGNASVPVGDERFTDVIRDCWKGYDDQPSMLNIAETLQWLHQELGLEGHRFQATRAMAAGTSGVIPPPPPQPTKLHREKATDPYATNLGVPAVANASPYASNLGLGSGAPSTPPPPMPKAKVKATETPAYSMPSAPDDVFIRLQLLDHIEFDVDFPGLFSEQGILRSVLYAWLQQEYFKRNHDFIAAYMQCVRTDSTSAAAAVHQMDTLVVCLDYLGNLAENEHGDLHDNEAWMDLSVIIARVLSTVLGIQIEDRFVSAAAGVAKPSTTAATPVAIDKELVAPVVFSAFSTLSSLCRFREFFGEDRQDIHVFARNMALVIQECLTRFGDDAGIVEMVAATVHHILILTPVARDYFDLRGIVQLLLKQIKTHDCIAETVINLVQAVGAFPISMLLRSNHKPPIASTATSNNTNSNVAELSSSELTSLATLEWCDVLVTLFHVIQTQVKALSGDPSKLRLSVSHGVPHGHDDDDDENDAEALQAMVERVIAACLDVLLRACEDTNVSTTVDAIDKFLYVADGDMIETLVHLCRDYPRSFHIQKGAIGLLAYILETGHEELNIERELIKQVSSKTQTRRAVFAGAAPVMVTKTVLQPVPLKLTASARLAVVLRLDPQLLFVIEAMQTFKRDAHIALEFQSSQFDHVTGTDTQARSTRMLSSTNISATFGGGGGTQKATMGLNFGGRSLQQPSMTFNASVGEVEINIPQLSQMYDQVTLEFDDNGEQITAASLQRYGSRILGICARNNPAIQVHLLRSNFNELIFGAFQQFPGDIALIHAGCIALSAVCRKDAQHQRVLHQLQVSKHLITSFLFHSQMWQILDGVTCALVGLLEPPELYQLVQGGNKDTVITPAQKEKFDGYRLTEQLSKMRLFGMPIIEFFAMKVCLLQCNASHGLVTNFLKLLGCMIFWKPSLMAQWENDFVTSLDAFLVLTFGKRLQIKLESALKSFARTNGSASSTNTNNNTAAAASNNKGPASPSATKSAGAAASNASAVTPTPSNVQELVSAIEIISQQETAQFVEYLKQYGLKLPLSQYIRTTIRMHAMHSHVVAIALGLRVSYLRSLLPRDGQLGDDLGPTLKTSKVLAAALFGEGKVSIVDNVNGWDDNIYYCLEAISRPVKNPVYLRYTLWLLLLLISKTPDGAMMTEGEVTTDLSRSPEAIASQVAIKGGIEWAVEVMKHFPDHYTLQCLATVFLRWMEIHGRLFNRSTQRLQQLHALLLVNRDRHGVDSFLSLDQEGHDPILMGSDLQKTFGLLAMHSDRLIRLVERHLQPTQQGTLTADGSTSPHSTAAASFLASSPQSPLVAASGAGGGLFTAAATATAVNGNLWDGICRPLAINIIAIEAQEDPATRRADTYYVFRVIWDTNKTWTVSKRFRAVFDFSAELEIAFDALPPFARREFARSNYILVPRTPAFLENRRTKLQQWIEDAMKVNAVCFYQPFLAFFDVPNQLKLLESTGGGGPVAPIRSIQHNVCVEVPGQLPVRCFAFDVVDNLLFVGCGKVLRGLGSVLSGKSLKGCVVVYALDARDGEVSLRRLHAEGFQNAVTSLAWDAKAHCLLVGLNHGVTMHYHVTLPTGELTYGGEVDCQRDAVIGLQTRYLTSNPHPSSQPPVTQHLYVGASVGGACYVYNMLDSTMLSQTMSMAQQTLSSLAYDLRTSSMFLGNQRGQILVFDTTKSPPVLRFTIDIPLPRRSTVEETNATSRRPRPVLALTFVDETRLLYCAVLNEVYVYHFPPNNASTVLFKTLALQKDCEIVSVTVVDTGRLVVVTDSEGRVVVFAPPAATAPLTTPTGAAATVSISTAAAASPLLAANVNPDDLLGTSASGLLDWSAIVVRSNAVIRDWLRAKGIDTSQATSRMDLLTCMQRSLQPQLSAVAGSDATRALCNFVDFPLFLWRLLPPLGPGGKPRPPATQPYAYSSFYCTGDARCLVFGTSDGFLHVVSLQQFVAPYFDIESEVLQSARQARRASTTTLTSAERVGGSTKTTRGKRSITALRL